MNAEKRDANQVNREQSEVERVESHAKGQMLHEDTAGEAVCEADSIRPPVAILPKLCAIASSAFTPVVPNSRIGSGATCAGIVESD